MGRSKGVEAGGGGCVSLRRGASSCDGESVPHRHHRWEEVGWEDVGGENLRPCFCILETVAG